MVFLVNVLLIIVYSFFLQNRQHYGREKERTYDVLVTAQFILLSGLRAFHVGGDTPTYVRGFEEGSGKLSWDRIAENLLQSLTQQTYEDRDMGYYALVKVLQMFTGSGRVYLMVVAIATLLPIGYWVRKNSKDACMSYVIFACFFFSFYLTAIRQILAMTLVSVLGYEMIKRRKMFTYTLLVLGASTIHKTAIIMLPFYFLCEVRLGKFHRVLAVVGIFMCFVFKNQLTGIFNIIGGYQYDQYEEAGTYIFSLFILSVLLLSFLYYEKLVDASPQARHYINALLLGAFLLPFSYINPTLLRLGYYYYLFMILLIPQLPGVCKERRLVKGVIIAAMFFCLVRQGVDYALWK